MLYAIVDGEKQKATPKALGACPGCGDAVRARCGRKVIWHWAHVKLACAWGSEGETDWHLKWKSRFPKEMVEVKCRHPDGRLMRADVLLTGRIALELQNSPISAENIIRRESTHEKVIWLVNGTMLGDRFHLRKRSELDAEDERAYLWLHRRKWVNDLYWYSDCEDHSDLVFIDLGSRGIFSPNQGANKVGHGTLYTFDQFMEFLRDHEREGRRRVYKYRDMLVDIAFGDRFEWERAMHICESPSLDE